MRERQTKINKEKAKFLPLRRFLCTCVLKLAVKCRDLVMIIGEDVLIRRLWRGTQLARRPHRTGPDRVKASAGVCMPVCACESKFKQEQYFRKTY